MATYILRHSPPEACRVLPLAVARARRTLRSGASMARTVLSSCNLLKPMLAAFQLSIRVSVSGSRVRVARVVSVHHKDVFQAAHVAQCVKCCALTLLKLRLNIFGLFLFLFLLFFLLVVTTFIIPALTIATFSRTLAFAFLAAL